MLYNALVTQIADDADEAGSGIDDTGGEKVPVAQHLTAGGRRNQRRDASCEGDEQKFR